MAARKFLVPIDLGKNELQNAVVQNLASAPGTPLEGQVYYDTVADALLFRNASTWINTNPAVLLASNNTWVGTQAWNGNMTGSGSLTLTNLITGTAVIPSGLTGATSASRYVGATASGAPASGTFVIGDFVVDRTGSIWICTTAGSPGTWTQVGATFTVYNQSIKANNGTALTQRSVINFINGTFTTATAVDNASQSDVKFDVSVAAPTSSQTFGSANAAGSATTLARSDHTHSFPAQNTFLLSGFGTPNADVAFGTFKITGLGNPTAAQDAATKAYVDSVSIGLDVKASVRAATTAAGTLATSFANSQVIDGVTLATNDRILIKNQAAGAENGIYIVQASGAPVRSTDADTAGEISGGMFTFVEEGTVNADTGWVVTNNGTITIGTTALTFSQFSGAGAWTAGSGLTQSGTTMNVGAGTGITVNADDVAINTAVVARKFTTATHASTTSIAITHSLSNQWVTAQVFEVATLAQVEADVVLTDANTTTFIFAVAPTANTLRFVIVG